LQVTQTVALGIAGSVRELGPALADLLIEKLDA
jgi:hypothetical protein